MGIDQTQGIAGEQSVNGAPAHLRRILYLVVVIVVLAALVAWKWRDSTFDWRVFLAQFRSADPLWLAAGLGLSLLAYAGRAYRWGFMLKAKRPDPPFVKLFAATAIGFTAGVFFGRAGEFVRPILIARQQGLPIPSQFAVWFLERLLDLLMVILLFGFALSRLGSSAAQASPKVTALLEAGGWALLASGALFCIPLGLFWFAPVWSEQRISAAVAVLPHALAEKIRGFVGSFVEGMGYARTPNAGILLFVLSVLEWIAIVGCGYGIFRAFGTTSHLSITDAVITLGVITIGNVVQIPGIGGGMQIATIFALTELYHLPLEGSTGVAVALWAANFLVIVPFGLAFAFHEGLNWHKLKELQAP